MLTLQAPFSAIVATVELPNPTLGDSMQQNLKTKFGFAMSGRIVTTISTQPERKLQYNFDKLLRSHVNALLSFMQTYAAADIRLTDYAGVAWKVKCLSNPIEFTEGRHFYSCQLEFQGIKL